MLLNTTVNATRFLPPSAPDGFWALFFVSLFMFVLIGATVVWAAVPAFCCRLVRCKLKCCNCRKAWAKLRTGAAEMFIEEHEEVEEIEEDWWDVNAEEKNKKNDEKPPAKEEEEKKPDQ